MNVEKIKEVIDHTLQGKISFPEVVGVLIQEGIESYHVDYVRSENTYYKSNGETHTELVSHKYPVSQKEFSVEKVKNSIKRIQAREIDYHHFSEEIIEAGCVYYIAYLSGKRVIYFGREGDFHVEYFPGAKK